MVANNFEDPQSFLAGAIFSYLAPQTSGTTQWNRLEAIAKRFPQHFIVQERVPGFKDRYLTIGQESDYPAAVLETSRHADSVVVATLVKERLVTWAAIDWLADLLTKVLGRKIWPEQIRHSGLKDRWAVTTQTIIIFGVTVEELNRIHWPHTPGKTGFFLKDIHWHDGRRRVHPTADDKRNRVYTETEAVVISERGLKRETIIERVRRQLCKGLSRDLRLEDVKFKDGQSGMRVYVSHATASDVGAIEWPAELGVRLKDVRLSKSNALSKGDHRQNRFQLKVVVKNQDVSTVENYLVQPLAKLERLAARQLGHLHGYTLVTGDYKAPHGVHEFGTAAEAALYRFLTEVSGRENPAAEQMRRDMEPFWLYDFDGMKSKLQRSYRQLNMSVEYKIVERLADTDRYRGDFQEVVRSCSEEVSMWVAAWQSWWWNRVLVQKLPHWIREMEEVATARAKMGSLSCTCNADVKTENHKLRCQCSCDHDRCHICQKRNRLNTCQKCKLEGKVRRFNPLQKGIPLLMDSPQSREYYGRLSYCRDGVQQLDCADNFVRNQFLKPRGNTPWRKAFIRIEGLQHSVATELVDGVEQTVVNLQFELPSGAYATTFLGLLFELEEPNKGAKTTGAAPDSDAADLNEETE
jgi:tRNA(Glu) U13 pseudouridine synthase TruD